MLTSTADGEQAETQHWSGHWLALATTVSEKEHRLPYSANAIESVSNAWNDDGQSLETVRAFSDS